MHVLIVADGRSPITRRWLQGLLETGLSVSLISSFPCDPPEFSDSNHLKLEHFAVIPVAFSRLATGSGKSPGKPAGTAAPLARRMVRRFRALALSGRYLLGPLSVQNAAVAYGETVAAIQPDLVHALRIPYEGMLASHTPAEYPLVVSIWGNDLTLHARGSTQMGRQTIHCLQRAQGLMADARRDVRLARQWGLLPDAPGLVVPGSGGLRLAEIRQPASDVTDLVGELSENGPLIVNPRGFRPGSVRNDTFFRAVPLILERFPDAVFACLSMAGQAEAQGWVTRLGIAAQVRLLPTLPQRRLWDLFKRAQVFVTPSAHDGTPNSLLEGMACECFPVAGDIESLREWIIPGINGLLVNPADPAALAEAVCLALENLARRAQAAAYNAALIARRADATQVMDQVAAFYQEIISADLSRKNTEIGV